IQASFGDERARLVPFQLNEADKRTSTARTTLRRHQETRKKLLQQIGTALGDTGRWKQQFLFFADEIGISNPRICQSDAPPRGSSAILRLRNLPKRIALLDSNPQGTARGWGLERHVNSAAGRHAVWIHDGRVQRQQLAPARALSQIALRELPERIAALKDNCRKPEPCGAWHRLHRANRISGLWRDGNRRTRVKRAGW